MAAGGVAPLRREAQAVRSRAGPGTAGRLDVVARQHPGREVRGAGAALQRQATTELPPQTQAALDAACCAPKPTPSSPPWEARPIVSCWARPGAGSGRWATGNLCECGHRAVGGARCYTAGPCGIRPDWTDSGHGMTGISTMSEVGAVTGPDWVLWRAPCSRSRVSAPRFPVSACPFWHESGMTEGRDASLLSCRIRVLQAGRAGRRTRSGRLRWLPAVRP